MKSATTSLRHLLALHPGVFLPPKEVFFFDIDDYFQHAAFFLDGRGWRDRDFHAHQPELLARYRDFFRDAKPGQKIGEDSTTYLASDKAAPRIASFNPEARIFIMLRDPVERAYSAYWHLVRTGHAAFGFEDTLRLMPEVVLQRSCYRPQVERYYRHFPRAQVQVLLFEEFITAPRRHAETALRHLGLPDPVLPQDTAGHHNAGRIPRWPRLQLAWNRWRFDRSLAVWGAHLAGPGTHAETRSGPTVLERLYRRLNPLRDVPAPPMRADTRRFLTQLLRRENEGLDRLIGRDLESLWFRDDAPRQKPGPQ